MGAILAVYNRTGAEIDETVIRRSLLHASADASSIQVFTDGPFLAGIAGDRTRTARHDGVWVGTAGIFFDEGNAAGRLERCVADALRENDRGLRDLRGEFSLVGWDPRSRSLVAVRDHLGTRPLFVYRSEDLLAVSNDLRCLLTLPDADRSLDLDTLGTYLASGKSVPDRQTFFGRVKQIESGSLLQTGPETTAFRSYWHPESTAPGRRKRSEVLADVRSLLDQSVRRRIRAAAKPAFCLSGGLDSSSVLAIASSLRDNRSVDSDLELSSWTCCNRFKPSEQENAARVAAALQTDHHTVEPTAEAFWNALDDMIRAHGTPPTTLGSFHQWITAAGAAKSGHDLLFDGNAADGILWGGRTIFYSYVASELKRGHLREALLQGGAFARKNVSSLIRDLRFLWRNAETSTSSVKPTALLDADFARTYCRQSRPRLQGDLHAYQIEHVMRHGDVPFLLRLCERNGEHHGVHVTFPFTDPDLVDYAFGLPISHRVHRGVPKALIRGAVSEVPDEIRLAEKKVGLNTVDWRYYLEHRAAGLIEGAVASDSPSRPYLDVDAVRSHFELWRRREPTVVGTAFFRVAMLDRWLRWVEKLPRQ